MGYIYDGLIPPAVLFNNPGITREEFVELLAQTHCSTSQFGKEEPWDYYDGDRHDRHNHRGLKGLAYILHLDDTEEHKSFETSSKDKNGLRINVPYVLPSDEEESSYKFEVVIHERNILEPPKVVEELSWGGLDVGFVWEAVHGSEKGLVTKIFEEECLIDEEHKDDEFLDPFESGPGYRYKMEIRPIRSEYRDEKFASEEELYAAWPQFHPDFIFNWSQERGHFSVAYSRDNDFLWLNREGRYHLDEETFDRVPASFQSGELGYVDLILTSEAIKHKAWKLLSYRGLIHASAFLRDFPDSKARYTRAVWDSHTSLSAKKKGMTISEFLRWRNSGI